MEIVEYKGGHFKKIKMQTSDEETRISKLEKRIKEFDQDHNTPATVPKDKPEITIKPLSEQSESSTKPKEVNDLVEKVTPLTIVLMFATTAALLLLSFYMLKLVLNISKRKIKAKPLRNRDNDFTRSGSLNHQTEDTNEVLTPWYKGCLSCSTMTQGQAFKFAFFIGLFACNIFRFILMCYESIGLASGKPIDKIRGTTGAMILQDLPTLFLMSAISLFIYYIGQLTIQLEQQRQPKQTIPDQENTLSQQQERERYSSQTILKPAFITFNSIVYIAYLITVLVFCLGEGKNKFQEGPAGSMNKFLRKFNHVVSSINGFAYLILTVTMLNYGSRLEKIVSAGKNNQYQQPRQQSTLLGDEINRSENSHNSPEGFTLNRPQASYQPPQGFSNQNEFNTQGGYSTNVNKQHNQLFHNMDVRIFILTVFLSVVLLGIAITELLCAWEIITDSTALPQWKYIIFFLLTETLPTLVIACLLTRNETPKSVEPISINYLNEETMGFDARAAEQRLLEPGGGFGRDNSFSDHGGITGTDMSRASIQVFKKVKKNDSSEEDASEDSEFGNFNPNLHNISSENLRKSVEAMSQINISKPLDISDPLLTKTDNIFKSQQLESSLSSSSYSSSD